MLSVCGVELDCVEAINPGGSGRKYYRVWSSRERELPPLILCEGVSEQENQAYISLTRSFTNAGVAVPGLVRTMDDGMKYLVDDAGRKSLYDWITAQRAADAPLDWGIDTAMVVLAYLQHYGAQAADWSVCYPVAEMDRRSVMWDLNYFKYCFLKARRDDWDEVALEEDFTRLSDDLDRVPRDVFMHRDFQSRNLIINSCGDMRVIDFQGGRKGPMHYDVASFFWQARAGFTPVERQRGIEVYLNEMERLRPGLDRERFKRELPIFVLLRILQTLGAYGFRGDVQGKKSFLGQVPAALANLKQLLDDHDFSRYPYLKSVLHELSSNAHEPLTLTVTSFSYKKGMPEDTSGNGGGYVFDCRATNNPGRYEQYKQLTGRDKAVIDFIERDGELPKMLQSVYALVDASVSRYLERGFTSLCVSFGCTGGQHRSVYSAEHLAQHVAEKFPAVNVKLTHREL